MLDKVVEATIEATAAALPPEKNMTIKDFVVEVVKFFLLALVIVLPIRAYIAQPFIVSGTSMVPTFHDGEYLIIDEISYFFNNPARGDVVVFKYPNDHTKYFIKRVIGLPGETVTIKDGAVSITKTDGENITLDQSYVKLPRVDFESRVLDNNQYYVMGDNRGASSDSRSWGPVTRDLLVGRAFVRLFPITRISLFPGEVEYQK